MISDDNAAYFFDLRMVCGGYAYYLTHTIFNTYASNGREVRSPSTVDVQNFSNSAKLFGRKLIKIDDFDDYRFWIYKRGWAIIGQEYARENMASWLKSAECIKAPIGIYADVEIVSPSALKQYVNRGRKQHVLLRDSKTCLSCGATEEDGIKLTMQHVLPYSRGGETTSQNLISLCEDCNRKYGIEEVTELYHKAQLHFGYDPSIIEGISKRESRIKAFELSDNLMQTRCEIW